ncbi:unnamed protein product [Mycena citricolor]|nr:unnamed protein product [Mycena citricolor]CAK5273942.1 unnamed protein product [Mycena citricolor]
MGQYATPLQPSNEPLPNSPGKSSMFSSLLRRKKKLGSEALTIEPFDINQTSFDTSTHLSEEGQPPLPPPKDRFGKHSVSSSPAPLNPQRSLPQSHTTRNRSNSEYTMISRPPSISSEDMVVIRPEHVPRSPAMKMRSLTLPSKWAKDNLDPTERARQRAESRRQRELEEQQAAEDDAQRLLQAKLAKEEQRRQEQLEEEARRVSLEKELKRAALQRKKREERERLEEEENRKQLEARKHADRLRRIEEHRRLESWRREQEAQAVASARLAEQERKKEEEERRNRIRLAGAKVRSAQADVELLTGWVTMQMGPTLVWRRRYFSFVGSTVFFYRSPKEKDANQVIDQVNLRGQIRAVREWNEGYEDLKAIPFSFAVEFVGDDQPWSLFSDTEEEKYKLLGLLTAANGTSV